MASSIFAHKIPVRGGWMAKPLVDGCKGNWKETVGVGFFLGNVWQC